jgi:NADH:ubiquinone reductase (non-electrogenic)
MASPSRALTSALMARAGRVGVSSVAASRAFSTVSRRTALRPAARPSAALKLNGTGRIAFRRAYADEAPKPKPGRIRRTFRWIWRLTYISVGGAIAYTGYLIYLDRHPGEQVEQDPTKKTLVILGESHARHLLHLSILGPSLIDTMM